MTGDREIQDEELMGIAPDPEQALRLRRSLSLRQLEVTGQRAGVMVLEGAHAGRGPLSEE
jgi:hypothetical protein